MKKIIAIALCLVMTIPMMTSCHKYEAEINVYNWGEYMANGAEGSMKIVKDFEKKFNIKVNYTTFDSNEVMYDKLKSTNLSYDVIIPSEYMVAKLISEDMLAPIDFANVPNSKYTMDEFKSQSYDPENKYSVPYTWGAVGIIYNKTMVQNPSKSWNILWDISYKDNILMINNSRDAMAIAFLKAGLNPNTANKGDIDKATSLLKEQKPLLQKYVMDEVFGKMEGNQAAIAPYYGGDAITMMANNTDLDFFYPTEGTNKFVDAMCIPKNSKNQKYAEMFINYLCEPEVAAANSEFIGYSTPNSGALELLPDELRNNPIAYPDKNYLNDKCFYFSNLPKDIYDYMQEKFLEVIK